MPCQPGPRQRSRQRRPGGSTHIISQFLLPSLWHAQATVKAIHFPKIKNQPTQLHQPCALWDRPMWGGRNAVCEPSVCLGLESKRTGARFHPWNQLTLASQQLQTQTGKPTNPLIGVCVCVVGGGGGGGGVRGPETLAFPLRTMRGRTGICAVVALEIPVLEPEVALIFGLESHSVEAHSSQFLLREREEPSFSMTSDLFQVPSQIPMN